MLRGEPHFKIIGLGGRKSHVPGAERHHTIGKIQVLQNRLCVPCQMLKLFIGPIGRGERDQFDLVELVEAYETSGVFSVGSRLSSEAGGVGRVPER